MKTTRKKMINSRNRCKKPFWNWKTHGRLARHLPALWWLLHVHFHLKLTITVLTSNQRPKDKHSERLINDLLVLLQLEWSSASVQAQDSGTLPYILKSHAWFTDQSLCHWSVSNLSFSFFYYRHLPNTLIPISPSVRSHYIPREGQTGFQGSKANQPSTRITSWFWHFFVPSMSHSSCISCFTAF